jgi:hypothetical protein
MENLLSVVPRVPMNFVFEGLDSSFYGVYPVVVGLNQIERDLLWGEVSFYDFCSLVIHHIYLWFKPLLTRYSKFNLYASKMRLESRPAMGVIRIFLSRSGT